MYFIKKFAVLIGLVGLFFGCQSKTSESVFPNQAYGACADFTIKKQYLVQWEDGRYTLEKAESDQALRDHFIKENLPLIKHIDRDIKIQMKSQASTMALNPGTDQYTWAVDRVGARQLWNLGYRGDNVIVGVIDGFVDRTHPQLANQIAYNQQFNIETNDPNLNRHGTHVSGIIAADPDKGLAVGIAPRAKIAAGQFMSNSGAGSIGTAVIAMNEVAKRGARILNLSWGGAPCLQNLKYSLEDLSQKGILIVTAAGNEGRNSDQFPTYPADFMIPGQINVASTGLDDLLSYFSNRGTRTVQLAAPGQAIISTIPGNHVEAMDGTSMSAPLVSGAAALLMSAFPSATSQQIKNSLLRSVDIIGYRNQTQTGGRINVLKAYNELKSKND